MDVSQALPTRFVAGTNFRAFNPFMERLDAQTTAHADTLDAALNKGDYETFIRTSLSIINDCVGLIRRIYFTNELGNLS